jgi:hypothetical protein
MIVPNQVKIKLCLCNYLVWGGPTADYMYVQLTILTKSLALGIEISNRSKIKRAIFMGVQSVLWGADILTIFLIHDGSRSYVAHITDISFEQLSCWLG